MKQGLFCRSQATILLESCICTSHLYFHCHLLCHQCLDVPAVQNNYNYCVAFDDCSIRVFDSIWLDDRVGGMIFHVTV